MPYVTFSCPSPWSRFWGARPKLPQRQAEDKVHYACLCIQTGHGPLPPLQAFPWVFEVCGGVLEASLGRMTS